MGHNIASDLAGLSPEVVTIAKNEVDKRINDALLELSEGRLYRGRKKAKNDLGYPDWIMGALAVLKPPES